MAVGGAGVGAIVQRAAVGTGAAGGAAVAYTGVVALIALTATEGTAGRVAARHRAAHGEALLSAWAGRGTGALTGADTGGPSAAIHPVAKAVCAAVVAGTAVVDIALQVCTLHIAIHLTLGIRGAHIDAVVDTAAIDADSVGTTVVAALTTVVVGDLGINTVRAVWIGVGAGLPWAADKAVAAGAVVVATEAAAGQAPVDSHAERVGTGDGTFATVPVVGRQVVAGVLGITVGLIHPAAVAGVLA